MQHNKKSCFKKRTHNKQKKSWIWEKVLVRNQWCRCTLTKIFSLKLLPWGALKHSSKQNCERIYRKSNGQWGAQLFLKNKWKTGYTLPPPSRRKNHIKIFISESTEKTTDVKIIFFFISLHGSFCTGMMMSKIRLSVKKLRLLSLLSNKQTQFSIIMACRFVNGRPVYLDNNFKYFCLFILRKAEKIDF